MNEHLDDGQLRAYLDGELGEPQAQEEASRHIAGCPACQTRLESSDVDMAQGGLRALWA